MNTAAAVETPQPELEKRAILGALRALKRGDFNVSCPATWRAPTARSPTPSTRSWG
jgi:hypothetical protein